VRRIFGPKSDEMMGGWRKLHSGEFHKLYSSPDIIRDDRMTGAMHVARTKDMRETHTEFLTEYLKGKMIGVDGKIILKRVLK
jgi:hypothetical protein